MPTERISLSLVFHNHQPVGNFGWVFEDNHRLAYRPMLDALERHPAVSVGLHYTGPLMEWLRAEKPDTVEQIRRLVAREQVEILGGGYYEPVLAALPGDDRIGQLERMADEVEAVFGRRPRGAWLAERVWEPDLPSALAAAGYEYTVLDDAHLRAAAIPDERHWGYFATDDRGDRLLVFGSEQGLRYHIPFRPVDEVIEHLRQHATEAGDRVGFMGDDGEKFGAWPGTWDLCWAEEAWVERFFSALHENDDWLDTMRPSDVIDSRRPAGRAYIPTGSYAEMGEWALPLDERREFTRVVHAAKADGRPEARWMRGGFWRNFAVNYREIGDLHTQMLRASRKIAALGPDDPRTALITDHLYRGQSNDCYWHGLFGGIYLSHMRLATCAHLIAAEDGADRVASSSAAVSIEDADLDGLDEVLVAAPGQVVTIKPGAGGGIGGWDVRAVRHALMSVLRRRPEAYHDALRALDGDDREDTGSGVMSIHDLVRVTEPGLSERLWFDDHERRSGLVRVLPADVTVDALERGEAAELGDFITGEYGLESATDDGIILERLGSVAEPDGDARRAHVRMSFRLSGERRDPVLVQSVVVANPGSEAIDALIGLEYSLNMLGGGGNPQAWIRAGAEIHRFDTKGQLDDAVELACGNDGIGVELHQRPSHGATVRWFSIETISLSEQGFERNHQGSCILWTWPLRLVPGGSTSISLESRISTTRDRAEEEGL